MGAKQIITRCLLLLRTAAGARAALLPRNLDTRALGSELRRIGLSNSDVANFIERRARTSDCAFRCSICWEDAETGDMVVDLQCEGVQALAEPHQFCPQCIAGALMLRPVCPLCNQIVNLTANHEPVVIVYDERNIINV